MSKRYPHCTTCGKPLSVRVGIKKDGLIFCNTECERAYYGPPKDEAAWGDAVLYGALEILRTQNPKLSENSLLVLHYLGWDKIPSEGTEDYCTFRKVRGWIKD